MTTPRWIADRVAHWSKSASKLLKIAATCAMIWVRMTYLERLHEGQWAGSFLS
jgi:hypothetical protein